LLARCNFLYGWFVLPESLPPEKRSAKFDWSHANPVGSLVLLKQYPQVFGLAAVVFIANLAHYVYPSIFVLFADYRFGWGPRDVAWVLAVVGVCSVIVNGALVGRVVKAFGERRALLFGLSCGVTGFILYGLASEGWMFWLGIPVSALWALAAPSTQALITRQVGAQVQGRIQGALMSLVSLIGIVAPLAYASTFGFFIGSRAPVHMPGAAFYLAAIVLFVAWVIAMRHARRVAEPAAA
jgi:DHA1 family tetracycline resistance protein-like MFS transporter